MSRKAAANLQHRILIYGFKPFGKFKVNISEQVLLRLKHNHQRHLIVFRVLLNAAQYQNVLRRVEPTIVLGLGLHPRTTKIRNERRATNIRNDSPSASPRTIDAQGPRHLKASIPTMRSMNATLGRNCGSYACNYSMWQMGKWCLRSGAKFGFLHLPASASVTKTARAVEQYLNFLERACRTDRHAAGPPKN